MLEDELPAKKARRRQTGEGGEQSDGEQERRIARMPSLPTREGRQSHEPAERRECEVAMANHELVNCILVRHRLEGDPSERDRERRNRRAGPQVELCRGEETCVPRGIPDAPCE